MIYSWSDKQASLLLQVNNPHNPAADLLLRAHQSGLRFKEPFMQTAASHHLLYREKKKQMGAGYLSISNSLLKKSNNI